MNPHLQNAFFTNYALHHFIDDDEVRDVFVSSFTVQIRCALVYLFFFVVSGAVISLARLHLEIGDRN